MKVGVPTYRNIVDGVPAAELLERVKELFEDPNKLIWISSIWHTRVSALL